MSNIAFIDEKRIKKITAEQAAKNNIEQRYYCPNSDCNAHLFICSVNGMNKVHFKATLKNHKHINKCPYASQQLKDFDISEYNENLFDFHRVLEAMFENENQANNLSQNKNNEKNEIQKARKNIRTILQLYAMCKSKNVNDRYGEFEIFKMLVDRRSLFFYGRGIYGYKVIECSVEKYFYNSDNKEIYLSISNYNLILNFEDETLFKSIKSRIYNNGDKLIIVSGNWQRYNYKENTFFAKILTKKQMHILK